tara:strand:+ start:344 stop:544 length:201 start_codon:yes stop_codon:yes gene_type:complete
MGEVLTKRVGECPFCTKGNEDERGVEKILREGKSEYHCGVGLDCIIKTLYSSVDESHGNKDSETYY